MSTANQRFFKDLLGYHLLSLALLKAPPFYLLAWPILLRVLLQQQRTPGAQYANYERMAPNIGGPLQAPQVPAGFVPAGTQPETIRVYPDGTPVGDEEEDDSPISASDKALERINEMRIAQGQEPFESMAEFQADLRRQIELVVRRWLQSLRRHGWMGPMYG